MTGERKKTFTSPIAECTLCHDTLYSRYSGEWRCCRCWEASQGKTGFYMDVTSWYSRWSGSYKVIGKTYVRTYKDYLEARKLSRRESNEKLKDSHNEKEAK